MASKVEGTSNRALGVLSQLFVLILSSALYICIILIALATNWAISTSDRSSQLSQWLKVEVGTTITVVRVLQGLLSAFSSVLLGRSLLYLQWGVIQWRRESGGISYKTLLALSPTTMDWGSLRLILGFASRLSTRFWALLRLSLVALIWLSGMLLFFRTSIVTIYDTVDSFQASAGIGPFNASYVDGFLDSLAQTAPDYPFSIVPYTFYGIVYNLVANPLFTTVVDPIGCTKSADSIDCQAYLLSGGLSLVTPFNPGGHSDYPLVRINEIPTIQLDFAGRRSLPGSFEDGDCDVFSSNDTLIAVKLCVAKLPDDTLQTGIFICESISPSGACVTKNPPQNITTTVTLYERKATMLSSRSNLTIVEISNLGDAKKVSFSAGDVKGYRAALSWLLDYAKAGIPAPSSIIEGFWSSREKLGDSTIDGILLQNLRSILTFPVWLFNANNWGNTGVQGGVLSPYVPPEFYKTASIVKPYVKLKFDSVILLLFIVFQGGVLLFLWALWMWTVVAARRLPEVSSFPLYDFSHKLNVELAPADGEKVWNAGDAEILKLAKGARVFTSRPS